MIRKARRSDAAAIETLMKSEPGFWNDKWPADALGRAIRSPDVVLLARKPSVSSIDSVPGSVQRI